MDVDENDPPMDHRFTDMIRTLVADRLVDGFDGDDMVIEVEEVGDRIYLHFRPDVGRIVEIEFHEQRVTRPGSMLGAIRGH